MILSLSSKFAVIALLFGKISCRIISSLSGVVMSKTILRRFLLNNNLTTFRSQLEAFPLSVFAVCGRVKCMVFPARKGITKIGECHLQLCV